MIYCLTLWVQIPLGPMPHPQYETTPQILPPPSPTAAAITMLIAEDDEASDDDISKERKDKDEDDRVPDFEAAARDIQIQVSHRIGVVLTEGVALL